MPIDHMTLFSSYEEITKHLSMELYSIIRSACPTYGDIEKAIKKHEQDQRWAGNTTAHILLERAKTMLEEEKNLQPVTGDIPVQSSDIIIIKTRPETRSCVCVICGKRTHYDTAEYCSNCGTQLPKQENNKRRVIHNGIQQNL